MDQETMALLIGLLSVGVFVVMVGAGLAGAWLLGRARGHRDVQLGTAPADPQQIARLERTVAALSTELERIGASQREVARLLADRTDKPRI